MSGQTFHNRKKLTPRRRELRRNATVSEKLLWKFLRNSNLQERKFHRQHSAGAFILDFYCPSERLAIELDGATHLLSETKLKDKKKDDFMATAGIKVLRFTDDEVCHDLHKVLDEIAKHFGSTSPLPSPHPRRGGSLLFFYFLSEKIFIPPLCTAKRK